MPSKLSVLLVDDNPADLLLAEEAFAAHAARVHVTFCQGGLEAMAHLIDSTHPFPHVVLLDLNMPGMNGYQVLAAIRGDALLRHIPVVILSSSADAQDIARAYDFCASSYLVKQHDFAPFVEQVDQFVQFWHHCRFHSSPRAPRS